MSPDPPSYEELREQAAKEWAAVQNHLTAQLDAQSQVLARSPDVLMRPASGVPWTHPDLVPCVCLGTEWFVTRWNTVNGVKYRTETVCTTCGKRDTWDWLAAEWMGG